MKIDFALFPDVKIQGVTFEVDVDNRMCPLIYVYKFVMKYNKKNKILVSGEGGSGKTTSLKCLLAYLLQCGQSVVFCDLKELNHGHTSIFDKKISVLHSLSSTVIILDSYDEADADAKQYVLSKLVQLKSVKGLFIGCRGRKDFLTEKIYDSYYLIENLYDEFDFAEIQPLSKERLKPLLKERKIDVLDDSPLYEILNNTMVCSDYFQLKKLGAEIENMTEAGLLHMYFIRLFMAIDNKNDTNQSREDIDLDLYRLGESLFGEYGYNWRMEGARKYYCFLLSYYIYKEISKGVCLNEFIEQLIHEYAFSFEEQDYRTRIFIQAWIYCAQLMRCGNFIGNTSLHESTVKELFDILKDISNMYFDANKILNNHISIILIFCFLYGYNNGSIESMPYCDLGLLKFCDGDIMNVLGECSGLKAAFIVALDKLKDSK